jgi:hypothetical protein
MLPVDRFPQLIELWDENGKKVKTIAERPMRERLPTGMTRYRPEPRDFAWRNDKPATLYWWKHRPVVILKRPSKYMMF